MMQNVLIFTAACIAAIVVSLRMTRRAATPDERLRQGVRMIVVAVIVGVGDLAIMALVGLH